MVNSKLLNRNTKLTFGKYKGKTLEDILHDEEDYSYILWLNEKGFSIDSEILNDAYIAKLSEEAERYKYD